MLRMTPLASAIVALLIGIEAYAAEETFDTHFMIGGMKDQQVVNIRLEDNQPLPGQYDIDIYVNKQWRGKYEIIVKDNPQETCLSREMIKRLGINTDNFASGKQCLTFKQLIQGGSYTWDIGVFRLDFSVPQAWVEELESGYVPPENWERGINAFYTSYYVSQYYSDYKASGNSKSTYVRFNSGLNLQEWQLHSDASFSKTNNNPGVWKSNTLYLERGFAQLLGTLRVGDMYTSSDIFDSVRFSGVRLFRDMQMLPNSKQNFTPRVQGIAQSNALVTIEQNGFVVYQKEVPPGPFAITDLQLAGGGADLDVSVKEADGSVTTYLVPYAAVPNMLQPGVSKYDFAAGRSHIEGASKQSDFVQAGHQYGFNNLLTLYGGSMVANNYYAFTLGTGWNTRIGAISVDATKSHSKQDNGDVFDGQSYQIAYNKFVSQTSTRFGLAAWRYSSRDYRTFNDHVWANNKDNYRHDENDIYDIADYYQNDFGRKNSFSANMSQSLPEGWGSVSLSTLWRDYWGRSGSSKDYQLSYSNNLRRISYTLAASHAYDENHHEEKRFNIFISIPFDWGDDVTTPRRQIYMSNSTTFDDQGVASINANTGICRKFSRISAIRRYEVQEYSALCFPGMSSRKIFRIEHLADEFIFTGNGTDSYSHTQASRRHFIQALVGEYGSTEIVAAAENEIGRRQVYAVDVVRYDFRCIRRDECETEPYCQAAQQSLAFSRFRRNDHQYFVLFFQHDCLRNSLKICIFTS